MTIKPDISLVVAVADNGVIGRTGVMLPWHLPEDMTRFRNITRGKPVIMGRKTYDTIGHPLPKRRNIIVSRQIGLQIKDCETTINLKRAIELALRDNPEEICIIGGGQLYAEALPLATKIYLTRVHAAPEGDVFFRFDQTQWRELWREEHPQDEQHEHAFTFINYARI